MAPPTKKARLTESLLQQLNALLLRVDDVLPNSLQRNKTKLSLQATRRIFDDHGFRTNVVTSPRPALGIYKDSCNFEDEPLLENGRAFLITMLGIHPHQEELERLYRTSIRSLYTFKLFLRRLRHVCPKALEDDQVNKLVREYAQRIQSPTNGNAINSESVEISSKITTLMNIIVKADARIRVEQLEKEYERINLWNSTLANGFLQLFVDYHENCIQEIYHKPSAVSQYERITIFLHDPDLLRPPRFTFLPALHKILTNGPEQVVEDMLQSFWSHLLRLGYFCTERIQKELSCNLKTYFMSGLSPDPNMPLKLNAHFEPTFPLSFYLWGKAGTGKSSLVRNFPAALHATLADHVDPELLVRFVKQTLNKPHADLDLELTLRPNNNDLSVMSIIQGRRMTMTQSKPGLVVVDLEEMPSECGDPNQLETCRLISQRFSGRNSDYTDQKAPPRNSTKRGISDDATLVVLFTSNYELLEESKTALCKLKMFSNLKQINTTAVSGEDRKEFASSYMKQSIFERLVELRPTISLHLQMPLGEGDTRPLVRHLRMLAFYVCALVDPSGASITTEIHQQGDCCTVRVGTKSTELKLGSMDNLFPKIPQVFDARAGEAVKQIVNEQGTDYRELSQILDYYFAKTLAPAVVVSNDGRLISALVKAVGRCKDVHSILSINASEYKIMRSLYDPTDTPNLRDAIMRKGRGAYCAIELICNDADAQLCIREIIEDSPSRTAISTHKSALYKEGLFFGVQVVGDITPEVRSRASLVL